MSSGCMPPSGEIDISIFENCANIVYIVSKFGLFGIYCAQFTFFGQLIYSSTAADIQPPLHYYILSLRKGLPFSEILLILCGMGKPIPYGCSKSMNLSFGKHTRN